MTEANPIPPQLSHLTQRDAAVRARAIEEAFYVESPDLERVERNFNEHDVSMWKRGFDAKDDAIRALLPTQPAPVPDEARGPHNACGAGSCNQPDRCASEGECHYTKSRFYQPSRAAPSEAAIRAELVAALREVMWLVPRLEHVPSRAPYAKILAIMERARAVLAKVEVL